MAALMPTDADYGRAQPEVEGDCDDVGGDRRRRRWFPGARSACRKSESLDGWGRRLTYHVSPELTSSGTTDEGEHHRA